MTAFVMQSEILEIKRYLDNLQTEILAQFKKLDPHSTLISDPWQYPSGGGGNTSLIRHGHIFEQAGVNVSHIYGTSLPPSASSSRNIPKNNGFSALGLSMVVHSCNPYVPTMHANIRAFFIDAEDNPVWWFGGGFDLTPYYGFKEDCIHWHTVAKQACEPFGKDIYPRFKQWCDDYFYLKHRKEPRGIGGIFFDDLTLWEYSTCFDFMKSIGNAIMPAYLPIVRKRHPTPFTEAERNFQLYRRGRYVEFNLVYDRGTLFGLQSGGRTESILMSLPPVVHWHYQWQPAPQSREAELTDYYLTNRAWLNDERAPA